ncbi:hypothetical protein [uncultured Methylobacterium sp.]|uniref:hypothetical protein n=1 Tax=uncultured Methylobacterium sp. TaxID=157278 RepID=UPI0035CAEE08
MIDLALDPSETRVPAEAAPRRRVGRIVVLGLLGLAGTGAFAVAASTVLSGLAGPQRAPAAIRQGAADWPDLKDGLPALATGSVPAAVPAVREIVTAPAEPARLVAIPARADAVPWIDPDTRRAEGPAEAGHPTTAAAAKPGAVRSKDADLNAEPEVSAQRPPRPMPSIVHVPVIGPSRQATLVAPVRAAALAPLPAETVRARTTDPTFAAPPAEPARVKPRAEAQAKRSPAEKPVAARTAAAETKAAPAETADEDAEVFGLKIPSLAPAGRKIRESVEALGDAVKSLPDHF